MDRVFIHWDDSNVFHEAQRLAEEHEGMPDAGYLVRIHFESLLRLAEAGRPLAKAVAAGSVSGLSPLPSLALRRASRINGPWRLFPGEDCTMIDTPDSGRRARPPMPSSTRTNTPARPAP